MADAQPMTLTEHFKRALNSTKSQLHQGPSVAMSASQMGANVSHLAHQLPTVSENLTYGSGAGATRPGPNVPNPNLTNLVQELPGAAGGPVTVPEPGFWAKHCNTILMVLLGAVVLIMLGIYWWKKRSKSTIEKELRDKAKKNGSGVSGASGAVQREPFTGQDTPQMPNFPQMRRPQGVPPPQPQQVPPHPPQPIIQHPPAPQPNPTGASLPSRPSIPPTTQYSLKDPPSTKLSERDQPINFRGSVDNPSGFGGATRLPSTIRGSKHPDQTVQSLPPPDPLPQQAPPPRAQVQAPPPPQQAPPQHTQVQTLPPILPQPAQQIPPPTEPVQVAQPVPQAAALPQPPQPANNNSDPNFTILP
jgi:hypothetical protein